MAVGVDLEVVQRAVDNLGTSVSRRMMKIDGLITHTKARLAMQAPQSKFPQHIVGGLEIRRWLASLAHHLGLANCFQRCTKTFVVPIPLP